MCSLALIDVDQLRSGDVTGNEDSGVGIVESPIGQANGSMRFSGCGIRPWDVLIRFAHFQYQGHPLVPDIPISVVEAVAEFCDHRVFIGFCTGNRRMPVMRIRVIVEVQLLPLGIFLS